MWLSIPEARTELVRRQKNRTRRWRVFWFLLIAVLAHLFFVLCIAPYLDLSSENASKTEVTTINPAQLADLKKKIAAQTNPLLKQEVLEKYKTKQADPNAKMMGPFSQTVPKETLAGAQTEAPEEGGGGQNANPITKKTNPQKTPPAPKKLSLSNLGFGNKLPQPKTPDEEQQNEQRQGSQGPPSPFQGPGHYTPVGREDPNIQKGQQNLLNAVENEYYSFFIRMEDPILRNWFFLMRSWEGQIRSEMASQKIGAGAEVPVTIEFVIDRAGEFKSIEIVESSGVRTLDWATKESVRKLGNLPNPPPKLFAGQPYYTRRLRFMVNVIDDPGASHMRPNMYW